MPHDTLEKYKRQSHTVYDCRYHVVWATKYRFKVIDPEHIHLYLQIPPKHSVSDVMKWIKGKSAERLLSKFPQLEKQYWGRHLWARGYFVSTVGITDTIIREYIQRQRQEELTEFNQTWKSDRT